MIDSDAVPSTVVLIPGLMCDATFWAHLRPILEAERDIFIPRLHDLDALDVMAGLVLESTSGPLDVVGHSMGGRVALEIWRQDPARIRTLALLDTGVHPVGETEPANRQVRLDRADSQGMAAVAAEWVPMMVHPDRHDDVALMNAITSMVTSYTVDQFKGQTRALLGRHESRSLLDQIDQIGCPTLVACGRADVWSPVEQHVEIAASIRGARLEIIEHAGHMVAMEQPTATSDLLVGWLADAWS